MKLFNYVLVAIFCVFAHQALAQAPGDSEAVQTNGTTEAVELAENNDKSFADLLTECTKAPNRSYSFKTAKAVRESLKCVGEKLKDSRLENLFCGPSAFKYAEGNCMENAGFTNDMKACDTPGTVRVYQGRCQNLWKGQKGRCLRARGAGFVHVGDLHGHIEFVGTDGKYHSDRARSQAMNVSVGNQRRKLVACYVRK